jgi:hypothetical protein
MRLPDLFAKPERILWDKKNENLLYVFSPSNADPRAGKFVMEVNWSPKKRGPLFTNAVIHNSLVAESDLTSTEAYEEVPLKK